MKNVIGVIWDTILVVGLMMVLISVAVAADITFGFTAPTEVEFTGITLDSHGVHADYRTYKDPTKTLGYEAYYTYWLPTLEEIGL